jgi:molybdenum cofactor cytidylyltransferase
MDPLSLANCLPLGDRAIVGVYGAGGKSMLLNRLARELTAKGSKVILSTTTKIYIPDEVPTITAQDLDEAFHLLAGHLRYHPVVALGKSILPGGKLQGIDPSWIRPLFAQGVAPYILVEADGASGKPIKGYASYEPVLPDAAHLVVPVLGMDAVGACLNGDMAHRPELLASRLGMEPGDILSENLIVCYLQQLVELGRSLSPRARIVPVLNKADLPHAVTKAQRVARGLHQYPGLDRILLTSVMMGGPVRVVFDTAGSSPFVSCVILASGVSRRMGMDKLSLPLNGKTILEHTVSNALGSGAREIIVVARPGFTPQGPVFSDDRIKVVTNPAYRDGISGSLKMGLLSLNSLCQGVIFALGDQPLVTSGVFDLLIGHYSEHLNLVTFPSFDGRRGNPVLFDRRTWPLLLELQGDRGGKQVIHNLPRNEVQEVKTDCGGILQDIDTLEDYSTLVLMKRQDGH